MRNVTTVIIIKSEIVNGSKLKNTYLPIKPGDYIPRPLNGGFKYEFESENGEEIKNYWDNLDKTEKISCINSCIDDKTKTLLDVIIEEKEKEKENAS